MPFHHDVFMERGSHNMSIRFALLLVFTAHLCGCSAIRTLAGADVDLHQLAKAREAAVLEKRWQASAQLAQRLSKGGGVGNADVLCYLSENAVNKAAAQLVLTTGWIDPVTSYVIKDVSVRLYNGSALAALSLDALNSTYDVRVDLMMDCLLTFGFERGELFAELTPFQIAPGVSTGALLSSASDIIRDIVEIRLSNLKKEFPPVRFPVDFAKAVPIHGGFFMIRDRMNMNIQTPQRVLQYTLSLKDILIFEKKALLSFTIPTVRVK